MEGSGWLIRGSDLMKNPKKGNYSEESPSFWRDEASANAPCQTKSDWLSGAFSASSLLRETLLIGRGDCSPDAPDWSMRLFARRFRLVEALVRPTLVIG